MPIKSYKPTSPGRRDMTGQTFEEITRSKPHRPLVRELKKRAGRNHEGRVSVRHRGGGHKRRYRLIDFKRDKVNIPARVESIEYDPTARRVLRCWFTPMANGAILSHRSVCAWAIA